MSQLMSFLHQYGYVFFNQSNARTDELEELFFTHLGSLELLCAFPHVLLMDVTYKTNRFRMPLFEIVGVTSMNMTFCIAFVFLQSEKEDNYIWALIEIGVDEVVCPSVSRGDETALYMAHQQSCYSQLAENQHSKLKRHLGTSQSDVESTVSSIHQLLQVVGEDVYSCICKLCTSNELPCAHELAIDTNEGRPTPLACIDKFWKKLDLLPCVSPEDDDLNCSVELQMFTKQFKHQSRPGKVSLLRKLRELINPSITALLQPVVKTDICGHPSSKKKVDRYNNGNPSAFKFVQHDLNHSEEPSRHNCSSVRSSSKKKKDISTRGKASEFMQHDFLHSHEPGRHSCSSLYNTSPLPTQRISRSNSVNHEHGYLCQFSPTLHPYIMFVKDVRANGNYDFRAIVGLLGFGEDAWMHVHQNLIDELRTFWTEYVDLFGGYDRACSIDNSLNFWESYRAAPIQNWMMMHNMGHLIASSYNVILHLLSSEQCLTFLPLRSVPPPSHEHVTITIGFVNNNHFIQVTLIEDYPMPPIMIQWFRYRPISFSRLHPFLGLCSKRSNTHFNNNLGSIVSLLTDRQEENGHVPFKVSYCCFKACKEGFRKGCRPTLGIDGCFLKGLVKGELLTAMGQDGVIDRGSESMKNKKNRADGGPFGGQS
ncbi:uncharacterized protein LOC119980706 [Tripterygium wilfordii]|uniref:uncharacterized protein LOC119980706 n=1 Tax=Tripterygium wilfordii TaxID=458696 RepID=UPI0018F830CE|nr:uncharacterized protein LOC119980706 [Tripterygium wilfordii]